MDLGGLSFEWDARKARDNRAKHSISFQEAATAFTDPLGRIRFVLLGQSAWRRLLVVMFTERGEAIRLISARKATRRERRQYEESES